MKTQLVMASVALAWITFPARSADLPQLNMDELLFSSDCVVEGAVQKTTTRNYRSTARVKVERTLAGDNLTGQIIGLDVSLYSLRQLTYGMERAFRKGDRALFFLSNRVKHPSGQQSLAGLEIVMTGVRVLRLGRVFEFEQIRNPGGLTETGQNSLSRAAFDARFAASRMRVNELKARLNAPAKLEDEAYFERWSAAHPRLGGDVLHTRLAQIHKLRRLQTRKPST